jgi:hypothetical protein
MARAGAERLHASRLASPSASRLAMALGARVGADLAVELGALGADFAHVAEHQHARPGQEASTSIAARTESGFAL